MCGFVILKLKKLKTDVGQPSGIVYFVESGVFICGRDNETTHRTLHICDLRVSVRVLQEKHFQDL